ncbi:cytochrome P450 714A1-like [Prosopis cineraria]|uniref:cytochrome P450 714A1-like n=1 Tax=Prosopis cineraria TaxID=364024 RepID=UPI00240FF410|nr:cytochrome P450 714A1-like [Prosopis cineraria]
MEVSFEVALCVSVVGMLSWIAFKYSVVWWKWERVRRKLRVQGIRGPPPSIVYGNNVSEMRKLQSQPKSAPLLSSIHSHLLMAHDYNSNLFPYFEHWRKQYGRQYTCSTGEKQCLFVNEPEMLREMNQCFTLNFGKPSDTTNILAPLLGNGILRANGLSWVHQKKLLADEFFMDKVKDMVGLMVESARPLLSKWDQSINSENGFGEVEVEADLRSFSADVISRFCFGHSYSKGEEIISKLRSIMKLMFNKGGFIFGLSSFRGMFDLLTRKENEVSKLEREIESLIWELVDKRKQEQHSSETRSSKKDLMHLLLEASKSDENVGQEFSKKFIVDNCKNIYFAGHETTAPAATWCLMLLALHPEWQTSIREEIAQVCPNGIPDADSLPNLKKMTMVIHESLRLFPPGPFLSREAYEDIQIGNLLVPKGVCLWVLIPMLHRDPVIWGPDANEFQPERFNDGVSKACKFPNAYVPFGVGNRLCLGKYFAMVELKVVPALIISRFSFSLSPNYKHSIVYRISLQPEYGVPLIVQRI